MHHDGGNASSGSHVPKYTVIVRSRNNMSVVTWEHKWAYCCRMAGEFGSVHTSGWIPELNGAVVRPRNHVLAIQWKYDWRHWPKMTLQHENTCTTSQVPHYSEAELDSSLPNVSWVCMGTGMGLNLLNPCNTVPVSMVSQVFWYHQVSGHMTLLFHSQCF